MLLIEAPALLNGDPVEVHLVQDVVEGLDSTLEERGVGQVEGEALLFEGLTSLDGLVYTSFGEIDVGPTCETVLQVPGTLTMTDEDDSFHYVVM